MNTLIRSLAALGILFTLLLLAAIGPVHAQGGTLDPSFGTGGLVTSSVISAANDVVIDSDDRVLVAGAFGGHFSVARFTVDGSIDPSFGTGGRVTNQFPGGGVAASLVLLPDGEILVAGTSNGDFVLTRYGADGSLDLNFGVNGTAATDFGAAETASAVGLQPDGRIIVAGSSSGKFALARYTADGVLDPTFGTGGLVTTNVSGNSTSIAYDMAIYSDGRIIAVGDVRSTYSPVHYRDWALARYTEDGALDPTFGNDGIVTDRIYTFTLNDLRAVVLDASERIVVVGNYFSPADDDANELVTLRYAASGARDASFGSNGLAISASGGIRLCPDLGGSNPELCDRKSWEAVTLQPDGKIAVAGYHGFNDTPDADFVVGRLTSSGTQDDAFGFFGAVETSFGVSDRALALALDSAGRIVVAGQTDGSMALARYFSAPVACEPGFYSADGFAPCTPAPAGTFVDQEGATEASDCAVGSFQPDEGQTACLPAPPGRYVDVEGAAEALACELGTYQPESGQTSCLPAPIGTYVDVTGSAEATACPAGQTTLGEGSASADACLVLNEPPLADAGEDQTVIAGQNVALDGSGSSDPDDDPLTYAWTLNGPGYTGEAITGVSPAFCAATDGDYTATLVVNDGNVNSDPDDVTVTAVTVDEALNILITDVIALGPMPEGDGTLNNGQVRGLTVKLDQGQKLLDRGKTSGALDVLAGFRQQVLDLWQLDGVLTQAQSETLVASVDAIIGVVGSPCSSTATLAAAALASVDFGPETAPAEFALRAAYPNPFNPTTTISFDLPEASFVTLSVYSILGQQVAQLVNEQKSPGRYTVSFDASTLSSGVYLYRLQTDSYMETMQMTLIK